MDRKTEAYKTEFKRWCAEKGYTARNVAEKAGISLQTAYSYMEGRRFPSRRTLKRLEEAYGESMRDLFPY